MHAVDAVVCAHDGPRLGLLDDVLECREVDFAQRTLGDVGADAQTVGFLVVGGEVLERGAHALGLHACDDADCSWPARYGSSDQYSKQRPPSGLRLIFTPGPRITATFS